MQSVGMVVKGGIGWARGWAKNIPKFDLPPRASCLFRISRFSSESSMLAAASIWPQTGTLELNHER